jgi:2,3-bisphosphoglycerate-dependent phosphoglycerate mutase
MLKNAGISFDKVFSSTQIRANRTADIMLNETGQGDLFAEMVRHPDLRERDYGDLTGLNKDETREKYGEEQVHIWRRSYEIAPPGGECLQDVVENRVRPYFEEHIRPLVNEGNNILMAAHGNSLRATLITLGVETPDSINDAEFPTGKPLVFELENGEITKRYFL